MTALALCTICTHKPRLPGVVRCDACQALWNSMRRTVDGSRLAPTHDQVRAALGRAPRPTVKRAGHGSLRPAKAHDPEVEAALGMLRDARAQRRGVQGYVYCIGENCNTPGVRMVKVGYSVNPEARVAELQTGNPRKLYLIGKRVGTEADEASMHARFAHLNILGEWFRLTTALLSEFK